MAHHPQRWLVLLSALMLSVAACDGGPTQTEIDEVDEVDESDATLSDPIPQGAPPLPVPAAPFADVPATSDTLTVIRPFTGAFRPEVDRALGDWSFWLRTCVPGFTCGPWVDTDDDVQQAWSDELGSTYSFSSPAFRIMLIDGDGEIVESPTASVVRPVVSTADLRTDFQGEPIDEVFIRRDRFWRWIPLSSGVGDYLIVTGSTEATLESTFTSGTATTETEEFGRSLTVDASLGFGPLSASVSGTLSESYSVSVEVTQESSETFSRTVHGTTGKQTRFMVWVLMERYTFTDADGEPLTHPAYEFTPHALVRSGVATALQATEFPQG